LILLKKIYVYNKLSLAKLAMSLCWSFLHRDCLCMPFHVYLVFLPCVMGMECGQFLSSSFLKLWAFTQLDFFLVTKWVPPSPLPISQLWCVPRGCRNDLKLSYIFFIFKIPMRFDIPT
jgi:hypothetical protein